MKAIIQQEHYSDAFWAELMPLIEANWRESESYEPELPVDPDVARYKRLDESGAALCLSARIEGKMVGYAVLFATTSLHHRTLLCGTGDVLYVERNGSTGKVARQLLGAAEEWLARKGINRTGWWCEPGSRLHKLLKSAGYAEDEVLMEKVLPCVP